MRPRLKLAFANALLLFVSIAVTYLVASFVIFRFLLPHLSLNLHPHFPDIAELFAQTSKAGAVPRDYITLLGNSYAEGQGDGLLAANGDRAKFAAVGARAAAPHRARCGEPRARRRRQRAGDGAPARAHPARQLLSSIRGSIRRARSSSISTRATTSTRTATSRASVAGDGCRHARQPSRATSASATATPPPLRCFTDLAETRSRWRTSSSPTRRASRTLRKPSARNKVLAGGAAHAAPALQKPPAERDPRALEASLTVFDVSLRVAETEFLGAGDGRLSAVAGRDLPACRVYRSTSTRAGP